MTTNQKLDLLSTQTTVTNKTLIGFTINKLYKRNF